LAAAAKLLPAARSAPIFQEVLASTATLADAHRQLRTIVELARLIPAPLIEELARLARRLTDPEQLAHALHAIAMQVGGAQLAPIHTGKRGWM
jgi:hypothetical protein